MNGGEKRRIMNMKHKIISHLSMILAAAILIVSVNSGLVTFADEAIGEKPLDRMVTNGGMTGIFHKIGVIGDSLSSGEFESHGSSGVGFHDMYEYSWGQVIARDTGAKVFNFSKGGLTAKSFLEGGGYGAWDKGNRCQAYIIALGVNDLLYQNFDVGQPSDVKLTDPQKQQNSFAYYYGTIIKKIRKIQPDARIFLMTMPHDMYDGKWEVKNNHRNLLKGLAEYFGGYTYVIDLLEYMPMHDEAFHNNFYLGGHLNPMGYILTARVTESYIDYIIRNNPRDFDTVGFIDTESELPVSTAGNELPIYRKVLENYDNRTEQDDMINLWQADAVSKKLVEYNGGKALCLSFPSGINEYRTAQFKLNGSMPFDFIDEKADYLTFDMEIPDLHGEWLGIYFEANTVSAGTLRANANLEYSENFADPCKPIYVMKPNQYCVYETGNWRYGKYQYRINLKDAFGDNYSKLDKCWSFDIKLANFGSNAETDFVFDNFCLTGGTDAVMLENYDSGADLAAVYSGSFTADIDNSSGMNGTAALVMTGSGGNAGFVNFASGSTVDLLQGGAHDLYWYMNVEIPVNAVANIGIKIMSDGWGDEGLISEYGALTYADNLSDLVNGRGTASIIGNNGWEVRVPVGGCWYRLDLSRAFDLNSTDTVAKLQNAKSLWIGYNTYQSDSGDGSNPNLNFSDKIGSITVDNILIHIEKAMPGDVNFDGKADIIDLVRVKKYSVGKAGIYVSSGADMNSNGKIDSLDIAALKKLLLGLQ